MLLLLPPLSALSETAESLNVMGLDRLGKGDIATAVTYYTKAIALNPSYPYSYINRSWVYNLLGRYPEAVTDSTMAIKLNPPMYLAYAYNNRAWALCALGRFAEAMSDCNKAIGIDPNLIYAYNNRGWALCGLGKYTEAITDLNRAIASKDNEFVSFSYFNRGWAYYGLNNYSNAQNDFIKSCELKNQIGCEAYDLLNSYVASGKETATKDTKPGIGDCVFYTVPIDCVSDTKKQFTIPEGKKAVRFTFSMWPTYMGCLDLAAHNPPTKNEGAGAYLKCLYKDKNSYDVWSIYVTGSDKISHTEKDNQLELGPGTYFIHTSAGAGAKVELCYELIPLTGRTYIQGEPGGPDKWDKLWIPPKYRREER